MGKPQQPPQQGTCTKSSLAGRRPYWTAEEDAQLVRLVKKYGTKNWGLIAKELHSPIQRKGKSCRWMHQLNPCIKHEPFSVEEERVLIAKQREFGNKWSRIAAFLPGRTDNAIKNHWHGHVKRRLMTAAASAVGSQVYSSEEEEMEEIETKRKRGGAHGTWREMFPVPLLKSRRQQQHLTPGAGTQRTRQEMECARTLLELAQSNATTTTQDEMKPIKPFITDLDDSRRVSSFNDMSPWGGVKREVIMSEEEEGEVDSENSKEPNNVCSHLLLPVPATTTTHHTLQVRDDHMHEENNNIAEMIQPDQQRILSETLESAGLAHYPVLPLCPIKEEDIDAEQHVVIVLQQQQQQSSETTSPDVPMHDSGSEGASVCVSSENKGLQDAACGSGGDGMSPRGLFLERAQSSPCSPSVDYGALCRYPFGRGLHELAMVSPHLSEDMMSLSPTPPRPRREIKKPVRFLEVGQKFE